MTTARVSPRAISPRALARLARLQLSSRHRLAGELAGEHRSPRYGHTLDFADFREYHPGDDFRRIDTNVLARLDVLRVKLFEADDNLVVRVLLDTSASMGMYGKDVTARSLVAGVGAVALTSGDAVVVTSFPDGTTPRRFSGRNAIAALARHVERLPSGGTTPFVDAAAALLGQSGPPGMTVVVSDLLTPQWHRAVSRLRARGSDLVVAHLLAAEEIEPELLGDLSLVDGETGEHVPVSLAAEQVVEYRAAIERWQEVVQRRCQQVGGRYLPVRAGDDIEVLLLSSWRAAGVLR